MDNITAKVCCFSRAYHYKNNSVWIFKDDYADKLLGEREYGSIAENMIQGIEFFAPGFSGTKEDALRFVVNQQLSPSVLGRSAFNEKHLRNEIRLGTKQYVLFAAGYDTFSFRNDNNNIHIFELDLPKMIEDRINHEEAAGLKAPDNRIMIPCDLSKVEWTNVLTQNGYDINKKSFGSLLGISYYLDKKSFGELIHNISNVFCKGSSICFDFPVWNTSEESRKTESLAKEADEEMKSRYEYKELEKILEDNHFLIYEHLDENEMTRQFFDDYNRKSDGMSMHAPQGVEYIMAVKS